MDNHTDNLYRCTVHIRTVHSPTNAFLLIKNRLKFILKYTQNMLLHVSVFVYHQGVWTEPGLSYIYVKTFGEITSLFIMRLCGSMLPHFSHVLYKFPEDGRRPKHVRSDNYVYFQVNLNFSNFNKNCVCWWVNNIQGVTGGKDQTSGECSLGQTIPI